MPKAAWCSECGGFVWIDTDGSCQNGHGPEFLTGVYEVEPGVPPAADHAVSPVSSTPSGRHQKVSAWVMVPALVLAVGLAGIVGFAALWAIPPHRPAAPISLTATEPVAPEPNADVLAEDSSSQSEADAAALAAQGRTTSNPNIAAPALDAFVARQYPGYRVEKRISFPDQWEDGRLSVNYLLRNERRPEFRLLVSVTKATPGDGERELDWPCYLVGDVLTDDAVFSVDARGQYPYLTERYQNATIDAFLPHSPARGVFAYGAFIQTATEDKISFSLDAGQGALESAMRDSGGSGRWFVDADVERGAPAPRIEVMTLED